jgi:hypothetical protein
MSNILQLTTKNPNQFNISTNSLTPHTTLFQTSSPLTQIQLDILNNFIQDSLFDNIDEDTIPEFITTIEQVIR